MPLTDIKIRSIEPKNKQFKLADGQGLYLLVSKKGKYWRYNFRHGGKYKTLAIGVYPDVSLKGAREAHQKARLLLSKGIDPTYKKKIEKLTSNQNLEDSFKAIALEWMDKQRGRWSPSYYQNVSSRLKNNIYPWLGDRPIAEITAPELLAILRRMESRGIHHTALKVKQYCGQVFRYAIVTGRAERDPSADLRGALTPAVSKHYATITDPKQIRGLLNAIDEYTGEIVTLYALKLAPLVFVRPTELRHAEWKEINIENAEWRIPAEKMKMKDEHIIPLSQQVIDIFQDMEPITGKGQYVFPSVRSRSRPMSDNTVNAALRRMGYTKEELTAHGFRAMASTLLNEQGFKPDVIERQLAHAERNKVRAAYNRAEYLPERRIMMQHWADYLENLKNGANVIPIGQKA